MLDDTHANIIYDWCFAKPDDTLYCHMASSAGLFPPASAKPWAMSYGMVRWEDSLVFIIILSGCTYGLSLPKCLEHTT